MSSTYHSRGHKYRRTDEYPEEGTGDRSGLRCQRAAVVRVIGGSSSCVPDMVMVRVMAVG